ncbi:MAG: periplasmic heavy metal sensor [Bryobacteraceae bacterium]|nr:periplasmic heavy metal sensor [Solibacteraceae bacterium]MCO5353680.1 periplasmic heavy metal sensor [Bryobacteraceae bacterium]
MLKTIFATFALSGLLLAQGPGFGPRPGAERQPPAPTALIEYLGLSEAQVTQLTDLRKSLPDVVKPIAEQIRTKNQALREEMQKTNPNPATVGQLMVDMKALREQIRAEHVKINDQAKALLTEDQKSKLAALEAAAKLLPAFRQAIGLGLLDAPAGAGDGPGMGLMGGRGTRGPGMMAPGDGPGMGMGLMGGRAARGTRF